MRKTKIVCTIGPATDDDKILREMMLSGMNVARFNFSHGDYEMHKKRFEQVVKLREELGLPIATMPTRRVWRLRCATLRRCLCLRGLRIRWPYLAICLNSVRGAERSTPRHLPMRELLLVGGEFSKVVPAERGTPRTVHTFADREELEKYIARKPIAGALVLVKGSNGVGLQKILGLL